ncbi:MAG: NAD-dependent epimerase/dehydratase family protein [Nitrososphaerales archaeon]
MNSPILVTGGAGFIGSYLVEKLLSEGFETHILDNFSNGNIKYFDKWKGISRFQCHKIDLLDKASLDILQDYRVIYHLAANPEVRQSVTDPEINFKQNVVATFNLLESIRKSDAELLVFASTSTVYGEATKIPTPEDFSLSEPISVYAASKLACEALISSYAHLYGFKAIIYRLANIVGENSTRGVIYDFIKKLQSDPSKLEVLGDGKQSKSYLYVSDCIEAIQFGLTSSTKTVEIFNVGSEDQIDVSTIAKVVIDEMGLSEVNIMYTGGVEGGRGWKGDVKNMLLDISKLKSLGWEPKYNSLNSLQVTTRKMLSKSL